MKADDIFQKTICSACISKLNDFHSFCSNVEANQDVLQFSQASANQIAQQPLDAIQEEFIELSDYSIKTENYIVTLSQNVISQQPQQTDPMTLTNVSFLDNTAALVDEKIIQPIVAHIDITIKENDEEVASATPKPNVPSNRRVLKSKSKSIFANAGRRKTAKKLESKVITDGMCDDEMELQRNVSDTETAKDHVDLEIVDLIERIDDDFDDDDADDAIESVVYESHEQFAGFPKVIIKDSRLFVRGSALLDLMSR